MELITSYLQTFDALRSKKRWTTNTMVLRFAALGLASVELADPHAQLERIASDLRQRAGWFGPLRSEVRYVVAAMLLRRGLSAAKVHPQVVRTRKALRRYKLPRGANQTTFASLLLVLHENGSAVPPRNLERMERIYQCWKQEHGWLTGGDDLPAAALHAIREESPESLTRRIEEAYDALRKAKFRRGNQLQLASHLMALDARGVAKAVRRFERIAHLFRDKQQRILATHYDEVAILALTEGSTSVLVNQVMDTCQALRAARPRPSKDLAFSLASGLVLVEQARRLGDAGSLPALNMLRNVQALLDAQAAAAMAAIAAATVASAAAG